MAEFADADNNRDALMTLRYLKLTSGRRDRRFLIAAFERSAACLNPNIMTS
jgi:hypothetical protein